MSWNCHHRQYKGGTESGGLQNSLSLSMHQIINGKGGRRLNIRKVALIFCQCGSSATLYMDSLLQDSQPLSVACGGSRHFTLLTVAIEAGAECCDTADASPIQHKAADKFAWFMDGHMTSSQVHLPAEQTRTLCTCRPEIAGKPLQSQDSQVVQMQQIARRLQQHWKGKERVWVKQMREEERNRRDKWGENGKGQRGI